MLTRICAALAVVVGLAAPVYAAAIYTPAGTLYPWEAKRTALYLRLYARANNFAGVAYISRGERLLARRAFGFADIDRDIRNSIFTRFHIAGVSKIYTATAVLLLEQDGKLNASDTASQYLGDAPSVTLANLLASRTDANYDLLARVVEKASGMRFTDFMRQRIFAPLKLSATTIDGGGADPAGRVAVGTGPVGLHDVSNVPYDGWAAHQGSGGVMTTAEDACTFTHGVWKGGFLAPASLAKLSSGNYGWVARERDGHQAFGGGGHAPGFDANLEYFPDSGTCVAILANIGTYVAQVAAADIATIALGSPVQREPRGYETPAPGTLAAFTGTYRMPANFIVPNETVTLQVRDTYLHADWSGGITTIIYPTTGDDFVDRNAWATVHFTRDASGAVIGFEYKVLQSYTAQKVP